MAQSDQAKGYLRDLLSLSRYNLKSIGWQSLVVDGTSKGLTIPTGATYALIVVESSATGVAVRYLECGDTVQLVSTTVGIPRSNTDVFDIQGTENLVNFRATQAQAGTHTLSIQYYK